MISWCPFLLASIWSIRWHLRLPDRIVPAVLCLPLDQLRCLWSRWGWGGRMSRHAWRHGWYEGDVPPMVKEMHDRLHGKQPEENKQA